MTQQTTADRIFELMREIRLWDVEHDATDHRAVANTIAAEIDALTRERDEARAKHRFCDVQLDAVNAEWRACKSALKLALAGTEQHYLAIPARIDDVRAALAEARAEVERLRPAAEAWEAGEASYTEKQKHYDPANMAVDKTWVAWCKSVAAWDEANERARAAKGAA